MMHLRNEHLNIYGGLVTKLSPTLVMDCIPPGSSVHGIFQARILEWIAISSFRGSSWPRDRTCVSCISCTGRQILDHCAIFTFSFFFWWEHLISAPLANFHYTIQCYQLWSFCFTIDPQTLFIWKSVRFYQSFYPDVYFFD